MIYKVYTDKYVAAILSSTSDLGDWLSRVPHKLCDTLKVEQLHTIKKYPFILIEGEINGKRIFFPDSIDGAMKQTLTNMGLKILTTYTIDKDFTGDPHNPGEDYMGILSHEHEEEDETQ
jgi:hypothetical protein